MAQRVGYLVMADVVVAPNPFVKSSPGKHVPGHEDDSATFHSQPQTGGNTPQRTGPLPASAASWLEAFATKFFACAGCGSMLQDPVIVRESNAMACRSCAAHLEPSEVSEVPVSISQAVVELRSMVVPHAVAQSGRKLVKVRRTKLPNVPSDGVTSKTFFHVVTGASGEPHFSPSGGLHASAAPILSTVQDTVMFQGLNPNVELATQKGTPQKQASHPGLPASSGQKQQHTNPAFHGVSSQMSSSPPPYIVPPMEQAPSEVAFDMQHHSAHHHHSLQAEEELQAQERDFFQIDLRIRVAELFDLAQKTADELRTEAQLDIMDLQKRFKLEQRSIASRQKNSSKVLKNLADEKYEASQYAAAVELYTKAIEARAVDGLTKLATLYGNRSAALYMSGRHKEALDDCRGVLDLEPESFKMYQRAAKCAVGLGDLELAQKFFSSIPDDKMTTAFTQERDKIDEGCKMLEKARRYLGKPEGDEPWLMLVALYSESATFRLQCAEHFAMQRQYQRSIEALSVIIGVQRTSQVARSLAHYMYMSGFEHFERARSVLDPFRHVPECSELLQLICVVDDDKQQGNQLFAQKRFGEAASFYTKAIDAAKHNDQILRILYCNRAAAYKELSRFKEGIEDCTKALKVDAQFTKAYARRARCHQMLGDHHAAIRDFKHAVKYDASDSDLADELRRAEALQAEEAKKEKDFYYVLGVARTATEEQIRAKYKELALRWHPDKCMHMESEEKSAAEHKFKTIGAAYQTLVDSTKRREYDLKQEKERLSRTSSYSSYFAGGSGAPGGGPTQPAYARYGGMPERRPQNFW